MSTLAMLGGGKTITRAFEPYRSIGTQEAEAARSVLETGILSRFLGTWSPDFYGGDKVKAFERAWESYFSARYAVSVNSATSGLIAAVGAIGVEPGDEVIVSPWTMSATATAILMWNAIPVFADIEDETYNLNPASIERNITPFTKAILVTDIFGHPADLDAIMAIARKHGLKVIEDCAQAPGAMYKGRFAGTIADIGIFSLNYHKHIHTGEGGMCVTDDESFAERLQLIRNHAEAVAGDKGVTDLSNMIGFNFRMTEVEAAIGIEQLKKLRQLASRRIEVADRLTKGLAGIAGLRPPVVRKECSHVYYVYPLLYDPEVTGLARDYIHKALAAEGVPIADRYVNIHLLPVYQKKTAYGKKGFPWNSDVYKGHVTYDKGICPIAELLQDKKHMGIGMCVNAYSDEDIDLIIQAFHKVWDELDDLIDFAQTSSKIKHEGY